MRTNIRKNKQLDKSLEREMVGQGWESNKIKVFLSTIPTYQLLCSQLPKYINYKIKKKKKLRDFFWNGLKIRRRKH